MSRPRAERSYAIVLALLAYLLTATDAHAICGEKGGPGYRSPEGKCVGWKDLAKVCGSPPTQRCQAEQVVDGAVDAATQGQRIIDLRQKNLDRKSR